MPFLRRADGTVLTLRGKPWLLGTSAMSGGDDTGIATGVPGMGVAPTPTYATTFAVGAASGMTVGSAYPVTITPGVGGWPPGESIALSLSGITGASAPPSIVGTGSAAAVIQFTPDAPGNGFIDAVAAGMTSNGPVSVSSYAAASAGPMSQAFSLTNWGGATSAAVHKRGVWFKKGDVAAGSIPALSSGAAQFYGLRTWSDGSLKTARLLLRDASIAASGSRDYTMTAVTGSIAANMRVALDDAVFSKIKAATNTSARAVMGVCWNGAASADAQASVIVRVADRMA